MTTISRRNLLAASAGAVPALALGLRPAAAASEVTTTGIVPAQLTRLDTMLKTFIQARSISCAQLAVSRNGKILLARGYGHYSFTRAPSPSPSPTPTPTATPSPSVSPSPSPSASPTAGPLIWRGNTAGLALVQPTSLFRIASLSKHITSAAIMRLVQDGKLSLGASVTTLLGLSAAADARLAKVTVLRLMQNLGGWDKEVSKRDYLFSDHAISATLDVPLPITHAHILTYATQRPLDFAPGTRMSYNNYNFLLLGRIIEKVSGQSYESYVKQKVLAPVGITRMRLSRSVEEGMPYHSKYTAKTVLDDSGAVVPHPYGGANYANLDSAGGWLASAVDLVRLSTIFTGGGGVLSSASVAKLLAKPETGLNQHGSWYAGGWWVRTMGSGLNTWHNGSLPGTFAILSRMHNGVTYCATFNRREEEGAADYDALLDELYDAAMGITSWPTTDLTPRYF
ncbi:serine hydrolase domain-containing protein [Nonomuraea dietziae]|uniref:serine hydrolase domain-containing protein n=1 Tax=Nonomuraea dietziae TaxID=65515 RepID=UPI0033E6DE42